MKAPALALAGFAALGLLMFSRSAQAAALPVVPASDGPADALPALGWDSYSEDLGLWGEVAAVSEGANVQRATMNPNVAAFLSMIAYAEGTERASDPYRVCYAYRHTIGDMTYHPAEWRTVNGERVREWGGEKLPDAMCRGAGLSPGCVSTAAGRYQMILPTWAKVKTALRLQAFGPAEQDAAAVYLIKGRGALQLVEAGRVVEAIDKCRAEWASLPGAGYGQPERRRGDLLAAYESAGGEVA